MSFWRMRYASPRLTSASATIPGVALPEVDHGGATLYRLHGRQARLGIDAAALKLTLVILWFRGAR
jgi:hypothetical protein